VVVSERTTSFSGQEKRFAKCSLAECANGFS
jgi:hypothetical protein